MAKTTEQFIQDAILIHGDRYDYTNVVYKNCDTKVKIICKTHGEFEQIPYNHITKRANCNKCKFEEQGKLKRKTQEQFIDQANKKHNNKFDYSKSVYINDQEKIIIICENNHEFEQTPGSHLYGAKCKKCASIKLKNERTFTREKFIEKAINIHGDLYDYMKVEYIDSQTNVIIICKEHGDFNQIPNSHLQGKGCIKCAQIRAANSQRKTTDEFIKEARDIHGNTYDYMKVLYINSHEKIIIICQTHGDFEQTPSDHLRSGGCRECGIIKRVAESTFTKEDFINKSKELHDDDYDYSLVNYINSQTKVIIICKTHGEFLQVPNSHIQGCGCPKCGGTIKYTKDEIIKKAIEIHGNKYDYSLVDYIDTHKKIKIKCIDGNHFFEQTPDKHINSKHGCTECFTAFMDTSSFIEKANLIHNNLYDYSNVNYISSITNIDIFCKKHGLFNQSPNSHLVGSGCPKCFKKYSIVQIEWLTYIENIFNIKIEHGANNGEYRIKNSRYKADGYCKDLNMVFEFHGCYYHGCVECYPKRNDSNILIKKTYDELYKNTIKKKEHCINEGYKYIEIWGCNWSNIKKNNTYDEYIKHIKCFIQSDCQLSKPQQSNSPLDEFHPIERRDIVSKKDIEDEINNISAITSILNRYENKMNIDNSSIQERLDGRPKRRNKANRQEMFQE